MGGCGGIIWSVKTLRCMSVLWSQSWDLKKDLENSEKASNYVVVEARGNDVHNL